MQGMSGMGGGGGGGKKPRGNKNIEQKIISKVTSPMKKMAAVPRGPNMPGMPQAGATPKINHGLGYMNMQDKAASSAFEDMMNKIRRQGPKTPRSGGGGMGGGMSGM